MLNLGTIFTVVLVSLITSHGSLIPKKEFEEILQLLKRQNNDVSKQISESPSSDSSSDEDSSNNSINGLLKTMEVIDLIKKANHDKGTHKSQNRIGKRFHKHANYPIYRNYEVNRLRNNENERDLELLQDKNIASLKKQKHQRLTANRLLGPNTLKDDDRRAQLDSRDEYSKVFVILDPRAVQKSNNQEALTSLVSRILSLSSSANEKTRRERNKSRRYKGFKVKNNLLSRRYRRDSKESYGGSMEDDYKQKRPRSERGGGGGGSGGRTAIPYIRQRGDIYERDH